MTPATDAGWHDDVTDRNHQGTEHPPPSRDGSRRPRAARDGFLGQRADRRISRGVGRVTTPAPDGDVSTPELPALEEDVYLVEPDVTGPRRRRRAVLRSLHALALDTALSAGGDAVWIDVQGHATTHALSRVAPSERALDRVHVARAFTTHQHHTLVEGVGRWLRGGPESPFGVPDTDRPAVLVCPALDALYREGGLRDPESRSLLVRALAVLRAVARDHDVPVLVTRTREDDYAAPIGRTATTITLERTAFGPRFECPDLAFETLVYPGEGGTVQTTFAFWRAVLGARHPGVAAESGTDRPASPATPATVAPGGGR